MNGGRSRGAASRIAAARSAASGTLGRLRLKRIAPPRLLAASSRAKVAESPPAPNSFTMSWPTSAGISRSICIVARPSLGLRKLNGKVDNDAHGRIGRFRLSAFGRRGSFEPAGDQDQEEVSEVPNAHSRQEIARADRPTRQA